MFQQIDLSWKVVNNLIVCLNWALNENGDIALFISRNKTKLLFNMEHRRNSKKSKKASGILKKRVSVAVKPVLVVVEKKVNRVSRSSFKVTLISLLAVI